MLKITFDKIIAFFGLLLLWPLFFVIAFLIAIKMPGGPILFIQKRVGRHGKLFNLIKIKTMKPLDSINTTITTKNDARITKWGHFFRRTKLDELPSLWNVLIGDMSLVGPRPDVPGYADNLKGNDRRILELRPGITSPATFKYAEEEKLLSTVDDPVKYNDEVIFPDKVKINLEYLDNWSLWLDIKIIFRTIFRVNY